MSVGDPTRKRIIVPLGLSLVEAGLYRSVYPMTAAFPYLDQLNLKTIISIDGNSARDDLRGFMKEREISYIYFDVGVNQEPFLIMRTSVVSAVVRAAIDPKNHPCLIYTTTEKAQLSAVCACVRKVRMWSLASIIREFEQFTEPEGSFHDIQFIENFEYDDIDNSPVDESN